MSCFRSNRDDDEFEPLDEVSHFIGNVSEPGDDERFSKCRSRDDDFRLRFKSFGTSRRSSFPLQGIKKPGSEPGF